MVHRKFNTKAKRQDKEAKKKKRMQIGISVFFVVLMVFSIFGIYISHQQNQALSEFRYNENTFTVEQDSYGQSYLETTVNGEPKVFYALPQDTFRIPVEGNVTQAISRKPYIAFASNPNREIAPIVDLMRFDFDRYGGAIVASVPLGTNITSISCANATEIVPVVTLVQGNETKITVENSCVQVETRLQDLYLVRDRLLYSILGIIEG